MSQRPHREHVAGNDGRERYLHVDAEFNDNIDQVGPPPAERGNNHLLLRRYVVPLRRMDVTPRRRRHVHQRAAVANAERGRREGNGANRGAAVPPSPPGFSSDSLADDSDFSSFSDFDDGVGRRADFRVQNEVDRNDARNGRYFRIIPDGDRPNVVNLDDVPGTSRGTGSQQLSSHARKRPLSSSSDSCVETGFILGDKTTEAITTGRLLQPLAKNLQRLRMNREFTDVYLVVEEQEIACHRVVLAACSQYFHALLSSDMREGRENKVTIIGHKFEVVELIVKHIYAESIQVRVDNVQDIVEAADYFQLDVLKSYCETFLLRQVAESNCLGLMQFAALHSLDSLGQKAKSFALKNFHKVSQQEEFFRLPIGPLTSYLMDDTLCEQQEEHVFHAAMSWIQFNESRIEHLLPVLKCVRLVFVSPHFLFDTIAKHQLLTGNSEVQELISEACKYRALGSNERKQMQQPHTKPRGASGISEVLFIVGGICNNRRLHHAEYYHPKKGWVSRADIVTVHSSMHSYSVCAQENNVYITGGHSNSGMSANVVSLYFSNINQWSELANMINPRERHGSATADGAVYVAGGLLASQKGRKKPIVLDQVERYKPAFNQWESVKPLPKRCYSPGVISYKEKLYVIGGVSMTEEPSVSTKIILDCIQCYDPLTDKWSLLPLGRQLARLCCTLFQDRIYMISNNASQIFSYDPVNHRLEEWRPLPEPGLEFAGLATFNGNLVITGGQKENNTLNKMFIISYQTKEVINTIEMTRSLCMHGCVAIDKYG